MVRGLCGVLLSTTAVTAQVTQTPEPSPGTASEAPPVAVSSPAEPSNFASVRYSAVQLSFRKVPEVRCACFGEDELKGAG